MREIHGQVVVECAVHRQEEGRGNREQMTGRKTGGQPKKQDGRIGW